ncbi:MAG: hypothetical protein WBB36_08430 [Chitinophagales bacterium]
MKKTIVLLTTLLMTQLFSFAQLQEPSALHGKEYGSYYIKNLKQGALVMRLNFKTKAINALLKADNPNGANQIRYQQAEINSVIMNAFSKHFKFCPVFFISYDSTFAFVEGRRSAIFLDNNLQIDTAIKPATDFFLVAELGTLETKVASDELIDGQETAQHGLIDNALVILNENLRPLHDPFPYYVRQQQNWDSRIKKLDKKFQKYYEMNK